MTPMKADTPVALSKVERKVEVIFYVDPTNTVYDETFCKAKRKEEPQQQDQKVQNVNSPRGCSKLLM